jgi:hypothetical protein
MKIEERAKWQFLKLREGGDNRLFDISTDLDRMRLKRQE